MPVLDRQGIVGRDRTPDRIPETQPTPLQRHYINLSAIALVGAPLFVITTADAALRFYRSARAWLPIDRGRALFRLTWVLAALLGIGVVLGFATVILTA